LRPITQTEVELLRLLTSVDFEGVDELRAQVDSIKQVETNCRCGCPSFTPAIDRSTAPASSRRSLLPTELVELERPDGIPRTVIWFADPDGYISNVECVYYDDAINEWPAPANCELVGGR
jgi:hypothetical protein